MTCLLLPLLTVDLSAQAAEVLPETGTITYTGLSLNIELSDINAGADGQIYVTEKLIGSAVVVDPIAGEYKLFSLATSRDTGDVQLAPDHRIWYTDNIDQLGVFDPSGCSDPWDVCPGNVWQFPKLGPEGEELNIGPLTFDNQGRVWVGHFAGSIQRLYRVNQINGTNLEYCPYDIGSYYTHDLKFHDGAIWFGDYANHRILRFEPTTTTLGYFSYWQLPVDTLPVKYGLDGLVFDASGGLWWAEMNRAYIGHLSFGTSDTLTYYQIPGTSHPVAISIHSGKIWYSDQNGKIGQLDPTTALPISSTMVVETSPIEKNVECTTLLPVPIDGTMYYETTPITFDTFNPALVPETPEIGWTIYTLPEGSIPAGMAEAVGGNQIYIANGKIQIQGELIRFTLPEDQYKVFLPLILR